MASDSAGPICILSPLRDGRAPRAARRISSSGRVSDARDAITLRDRGAAAAHARSADRSGHRVADKVGPHRSPRIAGMAALRRPLEAGAPRNRLQYDDDVGLSPRADRRWSRRRLPRRCSFRSTAEHRCWRSPATSSRSRISSRLGRFALVLAALDTGSSFEGMGASREVTFAALVEPGIFVGLATLGVWPTSSRSRRCLARRSHDRDSPRRGHRM